MENSAEQFHIRHWKPEDRWHAALLPEMGGLIPTAAGCWVVVTGEYPNVIHGYLLGVEGHGIMWFLRLRVLPGLPAWVTTSVILRALEEVRFRSLAAFTVLLGLSNPAEVKLRQMLHDAGAQDTPCAGVWSTLKLHSDPSIMVTIPSSDLASLVQKHGEYDA